MILIGGRGYRLDERETSSLREWIDRTFAPQSIDELEDPGDPMPRSMVVLAAQLGSATDDVVELSDLQIEGLRQILRDFLVKGSAGLSALTQGVRRFGGDPEYRSLS